MKKVLSVFVLFIIFLLSACTGLSNEINRIEVDQSTVKEAYEVGAIDFSQIDLLVYYEDETYERIPLSASMILENGQLLLNEVGEHLITIEYEGQQTQLAITIIPTTTVTLNFYYMNDLHGALLPSDGSMGMAYIGNFLIDEKQANPERTIILGGGDMVQGTMVSNYSHGESTTEVMDMVGFDATVIGNHEFDWGVEQVTRYYTGEDEDVYQAEHRLLGANVVHEGTDTLIDGVDPYTIIERSGLRIGVIGTMGYGLERSISRVRVEGYEFIDPIATIRNYSAYLRTEENVDIVVVISHDSGTYINDIVANFEGDERVDAIFNGHSHRTEQGMINNTATLISGANGSHVGHLEMVIRDGQVESMTPRNLNASSDDRFLTADPDVQAYLDAVVLELDYYYEVLFNSARYHGREELAEWMARLMLETTDAEYAFQNVGGTRHDVSEGEEISLATFLAIFTFDNQVMVATVDGYALERLMSNVTVTSTDGNFSYDGNYRIATSDYIFYHPSNELDDALNVDVAYLNMQDLVIWELLLQAEVYGSFDANNPLLLPTYLQENDGETDAIRP